jgi:hypothetical protein
MKTPKAKALTLVLLVILAALPIAAQQNVGAGPDVGSLSAPNIRLVNTPGGCFEGQKYYNLSTHLEYTATAGNPLTGVACVWTQTGGLIGDTALVANSAFGISAQRICHAQYNFTNDAGAAGLITPANNCTIPANAVITNVVINSTTAVTSAGAATISVGSTGTGSSATAFLAATGKASFSLAAFVQGVPVPQTSSTFVKTTSSGAITITVATAALTAGVIEIYVFYYLSST